MDQNITIENKVADISLINTTIKSYKEENIEIDSEHSLKLDSTKGYYFFHEGKVLDISFFCQLRPSNMNYWLEMCLNLRSGSVINDVIYARDKSGWIFSNELERFENLFLKKNKLYLLHTQKGEKSEIYISSTLPESHRIPEEDSPIYKETPVQVFVKSDYDFEVMKDDYEKLFELAESTLYEKTTRRERYLNKKEIKSLSQDLSWLSRFSDVIKGRKEGFSIIDGKELLPMNSCSKYFVPHTNSEKNHQLIDGKIPF